MKQSKNTKDQGFQNLLIEIKLYLKTNDTDSLQYLLQDEEQDQLYKIKNRLTANEIILFDKVINKLNQQKQQNIKNKQLKSQQKVQSALRQQKQESQDQVFQKFQKQYKVSNIIYGQNYSYPFLGLLQKMASVYFYKSHPNPFPQSSLKMLHSLIQTLFSYVFNQKIKANYQTNKTHKKKSFHNYLKEYLFYIFQKDYQKFASFHKLFKTIKNSISQKQISQEDLHLNKNKNLQHSPLISTQNIQELQYFEKISGEIKNQNQFKEFSKIKALNFLHFGQKRLIQLIDPARKFLSEHTQKQLIQLISFVLCRFVRKIILRCIRNKNNNQLLPFSHQQQIQSFDVKTQGNLLIDQFNKKVQNFLKLDQPLQQIAKRTFIRQFYQFDYQKFIPKNVIQQSLKNIQTQKSASISLPQKIWENSKFYQSLWNQRTAAQQYVRQNGEHINYKREKGKKNDYSNYIIENYKQYEQNNALLWIKYLTSLNKEQLLEKQENKNGLSQNKKDNCSGTLKSRKKIKLQSLWD